MADMGDDERKLGFLEKAIRLIPGYKGYKNKEERRDNDQLLRAMLVQKLEGVRIGLNEAINSLRGPSALTAAGDMDRLVKRLEHVTDEVRYAERGYRGWFDVHKVREEELDSLYQFDSALAEDVALLETALRSLAEAARAGEPVSAHAGGMLDQLFKLSEKMTSRSNLLIDLERNRPIE